MMEISRKKRIALLVIAVLLVLLLIFVVAYGIRNNSKEANNQKQQASVNTLTKKIVSYTGGYYAGEGFEIIPPDEKNVFTINITNAPFDKNLELAKKWLNSQGLDLSRTSYYCSASRYLLVSNEEIKKCQHIVK